MTTVRGRILVEGSAEGEGLCLRAPISFWGGVDPESGVITDPRHPDHGICIADRVLVVPSTIGSSSSSAIILELLRNGHAPVALILGRVDAILTLGVLVAREMGYTVIPVLEVGERGAAALAVGGRMRVTGGGMVEVIPPASS